MYRHRLGAVLEHGTLVGLAFVGESASVQAEWLGQQVQAGNAAGADGGAAQVSYRRRGGHHGAPTGIAINSSSLVHNSVSLKGLAVVLGPS